MKIMGMARVGQMEREHSEVRISIGTYTTSFDDLAISVHIGSDDYMAIIDPVTFKAFLDKIMNLVGRDNLGFFTIPIIRMDGRPDHQNIEKYISGIYMGGESEPDKRAENVQ